MILSQGLINFGPHCGRVGVVQDTRKKFLPSLMHQPPGGYLVAQAYQQKCDTSNYSLKISFSLYQNHFCLLQHLILQLSLRQDILITVSSLHQLPGIVNTGGGPTPPAMPKRFKIFITSIMRACSIAFAKRF